MSKVPTGIMLHAKSRLLALEFADGSHFELPCEYLRVHSKAAEEAVRDEPVTGKESVNITRIEPQGQYAIRIFFDDGHDAGIYSWDTLYDLGVHREEYWARYLERLARHGHARAVGSAGPRTVRILYFVHLVRKLGKESEQVQLPDYVKDVRALIEWLRKRGPEWREWLTEGNVHVTVNREFAEAFTPIENGDEIALVPTAPAPGTV